MGDRFPMPHMWSPGYGRPPFQQPFQHMPPAGPYGVQTRGQPSFNPSRMPFQPRPPPSLSQCLGLPRSNQGGGGTNRNQSTDGSLPEGVERQDDGSIYCKNCDKKFPEIGQFRAHEAHHRQCDEEGCTFMGTNRAVNIHKEEKHSAVSHLVPALETPEQIAKWREARRRHFPTAETVEKKKLAEKERRERGQVAQNEVYRHRNGRGGRGPFQRQNHSRGSQPQPPNSNSPAGASPIAATKRPADPGSVPSPKQACTSGAPVAAIPNADASGNSTPVVPSSTSGAASPSPPASRSGLGLLGSYDSGDDASSDDDKLTEAAAATAATSALDGAGDAASKPSADSVNSSPSVGECSANGQHQPRNGGPGVEAGSIVNKNVRFDSSEAPVIAPEMADEAEEGEVVDGDADALPIDPSAIVSALLADAGRFEPAIPPPPQTSDEASTQLGMSNGAGQMNQPNQRLTKKQKQKQKQKQRHNQQALQPSKPTLLEKLLTSEVRRERNVLLQCIRHVVQQDFFSGTPCPRPAHSQP